MDLTTSCAALARACRMAGIADGFNDGSAARAYFSRPIPENITEYLFTDWVSFVRAKARSVHRRRVGILSRARPFRYPFLQSTKGRRHTRCALEVSAAICRFIEVRGGPLSFGGTEGVDMQNRVVTGRHRSRKSRISRIAQSVSRWLRGVRDAPTTKQPLRAEILNSLADCRVKGCLEVRFSAAAEFKVRMAHLQIDGSRTPRLSFSAAGTETSSEEMNLSAARVVAIDAQSTYKQHCLSVRTAYGRSCVLRVASETEKLKWRRSLEIAARLSGDAKRHNHQASREALDSLNALTNALARTVYTGGTGLPITSAILMDEVYGQLMSALSPVETRTRVLLLTALCAMRFRPGVDLIGPLVGKLVSLESEWFRNSFSSSTPGCEPHIQAVLSRFIFWALRLRCRAPLSLRAVTGFVKWRIEQDTKNRKETKQ